MRHALLLTLVLLLGCTPFLTTATQRVNDGRALIEVAHGAITDACVPAYQKVATEADLARVDALCVPAKDAYQAARAAWIVAVAAVIAAQDGGDMTAIKASLPRFLAAVAVLVAALGKAAP